jgi:hypothetical protein
MTDNMRIWNEVQRTDPDYTKQVNFGRKFTAIDAHYQIMMATKQFGPIGIGWGYDAGDPIFESGAVIVPVTLWHSDDRSTVFGPVYGGAAMFQKDKLDTDAPKKAGTDALTKLLSQLGFNADVFLKKFDDNKYVAQLKAEKAENDPAKKQPESKNPSEGEKTAKAEREAKTEGLTVALIGQIEGLSPDGVGALLQDNQTQIAWIEKHFPAHFKRIETAAANAGAPIKQAS